MFCAMTDYFAELTADLDAIGVDVEKAKMSRSEAGRVAANARWGNKGGAPKMVDWRTAAGISPAEQKSNARSKSAMQGARTKAQNKEANTRTPGSIQAEMERAGVPKKTIDAITKNPLGSASAKATAAHIKRVKDVNGLSSKQKTKYNEKMDMPTPGMSPDMKHQDAIVYALDAKAARPRAAAGRAAANARFGTVASQTSSGNKDLERAKQIARDGNTPTKIAERKKMAQVGLAKGYAIGVDVEKAKMSRSEAGRVAANARWGNKGGGAPKMVEGGWRSAAGIPAGEQKSNARSKAGMQGARTRAQNKESMATDGGSPRAVASESSGKKVFTSSTVPNPGMRAPVSAHKEAIAAAQYHLENSKLTGAQTKKLNNTVRRSKDAIDRLENPEYNALKDRALRDMPSRNNGGSRGTGYLVGR